MVVAWHAANYRPERNGSKFDFRPTAASPIEGVALWPCQYSLNHCVRERLDARRIIALSRSAPPVYAEMPYKGSINE